MKSIARVGLLLGIAGVFAASSLNASDFRGKFTLPQQAYWGGAVLPAGDYTLALDRTGAIEKLEISRGTRTVALIIPQSSEMNPSEDSSIRIVDHRVRSLHLAVTGVTYSFPAHKNDREFLSSAAGMRGVVAVPIAMK